MHAQYMCVKNAAPSRINWSHLGSKSLHKPDLVLKCSLVDYLFDDNDAHILLL